MPNNWVCYNSIYLYIFIYIVPNIAVGVKNKSIDIIGLTGKNNDNLCQYIDMGVKISTNYPYQYIGWGKDTYFKTVSNNGLKFIQLYERIMIWLH